MDQQLTRQTTIPAYKDTTAVPSVQLLAILSTTAQKPYCIQSGSHMVTLGRRRMQATNQEETSTVGKQYPVWKWNGSKTKKGETFSKEDPRKKLLSVLGSGEEREGWQTHVSAFPDLVDPALLVLGHGRRLRRRESPTSSSSERSCSSSGGCYLELERGIRFESSSLLYLSLWE